MARVASLPILQPNLLNQRYSCHACGNCCRDFTVQLRERDLRKLEEQKWEEKLGEPVTIRFRGTEYLRQRPDGACIFWMEDGRCRIHAEFGFENKPIACQLFPFSLTAARGGAVVGLNFACQSVLENKGAALTTHKSELARMSTALEELEALREPPMLTDGLRASDREIELLTLRLDGWFKRTELPIDVRLDGLAWLTGSLASARLSSVRDERFKELVDLLISALPDELEHLPVDRPGRSAVRMLRQAAFARTEDPKIGRVLKTGRARTVLGQLWRSWRFSRAFGTAPAFSQEWPSGTKLSMVGAIHPAHDPAEVEAIDDLLTRYLRARLLGGRTWGRGHYNWPVVNGLQSLVLGVLVTGWLARLHAAGAGRERIAIEDVRAALGRVDRTSGRAKWLGTSTERLRLHYLHVADQYRPLLKRYRFVE